MRRRGLAALALAVDVALIALFGVGYAARYVHPAQLWWGELVAVGLPYVTLALVAATAAAALRRSWRWVLPLHLVVLVLAAVRFVPPALWQGEAEAADALSLVTYNVPAGGGGPPHVKGRAMQAFIEARLPEVLCLQEATLRREGTPPQLDMQPYLSVLMDSLGYAPTIGPAYQGLGHWTQQPVFSRLPIRDANQFDWVLSPPDRYDTEVVRAELSWQGRPFVLYNVYLRSFGRAKPWDEEAGGWLDVRLWRQYADQYRRAILHRVREVERLQEALAEETAPVIICGDFNSTPHNWAYGQLTETFTDAFRAAGDGWGGTYHTRLPFARIDYVLVDPAFEVTGAHVLPDGDLSDHQPLAVQLRWRDE